MLFPVCWSLLQSIHDEHKDQARIDGMEENQLHGAAPRRRVRHAHHQLDQARTNASSTSARACAFAWTVSTAWEASCSLPSLTKVGTTARTSSLLDFFKVQRGGNPAVAQRAGTLAH